MSSSLPRFLEDPPPEFAFEVTASSIALSRTRSPAAEHEVALPPGVLAPSPVRENILDAVAFAAAVRKLVPATTGRGRRGAALILPDNSVRIAVLDFEALPEKEEERLALIHFRLRKTVPFDVDGAALSYYPQAGGKVLVVLAPSEIVAHYEAPFRVAGLHPGLVTVSSLAMLELLPARGSLVLAHLGPGTLTVLGLNDGVVTIARSLELTSADPVAEISADIYPTLAFIEDQSGSRPERLFLAGFGSDGPRVASRLSEELDLAAEAMHEPHPGLAGYLASLNPHKRAVAA